MPLQAVLFDLWETLIRDTPERGEPRRVWRTARVQEALAGHGLDAGAEAIVAALDAASLALTALHDTGLDAPSRAGLFVDELARTTGLRAPPAAIPELERAITTLRPDLAPLPAPHAIETLAALKAMGLRTALVSNAGFTTAPSLRVLLDHHGFRPYLDVLVFSDELGLAKPASRTFQHALAGLGCDAKAAAFVGDTPYNDVFGSQSAGLFAVQLGAKARDGIRPEAQIETLADLIPALRAHALLAP